MNTCEHIEGLFSDRFDGELTAPEQATFDDHLASCPTCKASWLDYQATVGLLRASGHRKTSPELHAATLAAVAAAERLPLPTRRSLPLLVSALAGAAAALLFAWLLFGNSDSGALDVTVDGAQVVALQPGESKTSGSVTLWRSQSGQLSLRTAVVEPKYIERTVEVPVEVRVEVPVERIVEVPVETIVEVQVPAPAPPPVEVLRGPLFTVDTAPLANALHAVSEQFAASLLELRTANRSAPPKLPTTQPARTPELAATGLASNAASQDEPPALRVSRIDGRMQIQTSGTLEELVPTLLAQLNTPDAEVHAMIERRLVAIHQEAALDPFIGDSLAAMPESQNAPLASERSWFGRRTPSQEPLSTTAAWSEWWQANRALITQTASL